ncbi:MAG TPA: serine/threonine-protein kinase [Chthonomonadaceae bacterium]|nr:serine/threonine-protein kinase [Chthonomonadaceae bacterium]
MASAPLEIGTLLNGRYLIQSIIGQGGMGTVYLAQHLRLETTVAVKELRGHYASEEEKQAALAQFESEARFLVRLNHPNLPKVTDAFVENDRCYMVMEYITGVTLEQRLKEAGGAGLDVAQVVEWGLQIADVLAYLHSQTPPVIFRDMKPGNVMVQPDGSVRLIDFGIARRFHPGAAKDTALFGSVGYSPPEQFGLRQTDPRADVYAFGATLHHLLTGRDPAVQPFKFPPAHTLNPAVPESLSRLLEACLAVEPDKRPAGIHEVAINLLAVRDELTAHLAALTTTADAPAAAGAESAPKSGSGPRIISSKLAEAEAQKRRGSGKRSPSGAATEAGRRPGAGRSRTGPGWLIGAVCLLLILGGTALVLVKSSHRGHPNGMAPAPASTAAAAPPVSTAQAPASAPMSDPDTAAPTPEDSPASFDLPVGQELVTDSQGGKTLRLHITGRVQGQAGKSGVLAVFFYDGDGNRILASDPGSVYAHRDGQLIGTQSVHIASDDEPLDATITVPWSQFPDPPPASIRFRCRLFLNHQSVGATDLLDLNPIPVTPANTPSSGEPGSNAPPDSSQPYPNGDTGAGGNARQSGGRISGGGIQ